MSSFNGNFICGENNSLNMIRSLVWTYFAYIHQDLSITIYITIIIITACDAPFVNRSEAMNRMQVRMVVTLMVTQPNTCHQVLFVTINHWTTRMHICTHDETHMILKTRDKAMATDAYINLTHASIDTR